MSKNKRFTDTYLYRFIIITIVAALTIGSGMAIIISTNTNEIAKYVILSLLLSLYLGALVYSYIAYRKKYKD